MAVLGICPHRSGLYPEHQNLKISQVDTDFLVWLSWNPCFSMVAVEHSFKNAPRVTHSEAVERIPLELSHSCAFTVMI